MSVLTLSGLLMLLWRGPALLLWCRATLLLRSRPALLLRRRATLLLRSRPALLLRSRPTLLLRRWAALLLRGGPALLLRGGPALLLRRRATLLLRRRPALLLRCRPLWRRSLTLWSSPELRRVLLLPLWLSLVLLWGCLMLLRCCLLLLLPLRIVAAIAMRVAAIRATAIYSARSRMVLHRQRSCHGRGLRMPAIGARIRAAIVLRGLDMLLLDAGRRLMLLVQANLLLRRWPVVNAMGTVERHVIVVLNRVLPHDGRIHVGVVDDPGIHVLHRCVVRK